MQGPAQTVTRSFTALHEDRMTQAMAMVAIPEAKVSRTPVGMARPETGF